MLGKCCGGGKTYPVSQGNNVYVFPGVGLGALVAEAHEVSDAMFTVAAETLAAHVSDADIAAGRLFPPLDDLRKISRAIAEAVVREARQEDVGRLLDDEEIAAAVDAQMWMPAYANLAPHS